jgi:DNA-binding sugar fermentation-stimulating protein
MHVRVRGSTCLTQCGPQLEGETEPTVVHCPNTGPMTGLLDRPLAPVLVSVSSNAKRK